MGDSEWFEVRNKNRKSTAFQRNGWGFKDNGWNVNNMGKYRTKEDDVARISTFVYVSNIQDSITAKDLFQACKQYGHVVDTFIPTKRDKNGKRFGFVRDGKSYMGVLKGDINPVVEEPKSEPVLVLGDDCMATKDVSNALFGRVKEFASLANLNVAAWFSLITEASLDFMVEGRIAWKEVEGIPLKLWSGTTFSRIANKWGKLLDVDDQEDSCFHSKRLCINTKLGSCINEAFKVIHRGKTFWIREFEVPGWVPEFNDDLDYEDDHEEKHYPMWLHLTFHIKDITVTNSEGRRSTETVLRTVECCVKSCRGVSPGFSPSVKRDDKVDDHVIGAACSDDTARMNNKDEYPEVLRVFHKVVVLRTGWINHSDAVGNSGGILYVWDPNVYCKSSSTVSDSFVITRGHWRLSRNDMMVIAIYAPQDNRDKQLHCG
ncbi:nucleotide-binding alpha-beta plait domain-containing protein [Tanacetum coccineum]